MTREGLKLQPSKVNDIVNFARQKNVKELIRFLGLVNFKKELWKRRAHHLAPLTSLSNKKKLMVKWNPDLIEVLPNIKEIFARNELLFYPNFNQPFVTHTDVSKY